jgi:iron complex outermembrane recepter protein
MRQGLLHGGLALNYVSGFDDDRYTPIDSIASWTTVDLNFGLDWSGISAELVARNLFDSPPPFVLPAPVAPTDFPNYDPANASVIGRSLSLQLSRHW